jgi:hypothetical protein
VEVRSGRLSITPLEIEAAQVGRLRERIPEAMYESRSKTLSLRVGDQRDALLESLLALTDALRDALAEAESTEEQVGMLPAS